MVMKVGFNHLLTTHNFDLHDYIFKLDTFALHDYNHIIIVFLINAYTLCPHGLQISCPTIF
jgi:hypothetical protein